MAVNIIADFFGLINVQFFDAVSVILFISFIIWEIPRSVKIISEEYTKGVYPEHGRVVDIIFFILGLVAVLYFAMGSSQRIITFLKTPGITSIFLILMLAIPIIIVMGYFKRLFGCVEKHESVTIFMTHGFLDLMHTLFLISTALLFIPAAGHLLLGK